VCLCACAVVCIVFVHFVCFVCTVQWVVGSCVYALVYLRVYVCAVCLQWRVLCLCTCVCVCVCVRACVFSTAT
jgi:hypothetical protein